MASTPTISNTLSNTGSTNGLVKPIAFGNSQPSPLVGGFSVPNTQAGGSNPFPGLISGISNFLGPTTNQSTPAFASGAGSAPTNIGSFAASNPAVKPIAQNTSSSVPNSPSIVQPNQNITPVSATQPTTTSNNAGLVLGDANATNTVPTSSETNSYSGGVNSGGQSLPGYGQSNFTTAGILPGLLQNSQANPQVDQANKNLQDLQNNYAEQKGIIGNSPIGLSEQGGEQGLLNQQYASKLGAAQTAVQNAQQEQTIQQQGLTSALGAVAPITGVAYGTQTIQPGELGANGQGSGGQVSPSDPFYQTLQTYAQQLASNQGASIPSSISGNPVLQAQVLQMAKQINPNFNYNTSQGIAQGQQQVGATGGAIASGQQQTVAQYTSAAQQAQNLGQQLTQLVNAAGINPNDVNKVNSFMQGVANNTSNPNYQTFHNLINDLASTYAQVLTPAGGTVTDKVRDISASLLDATASGQSILQVMKNLDAQVQAKIAGVPTNNSPSTLNGTTNTQSNGANPWH